MSKAQKGNKENKKPKADKSQSKANSTGRRKTRASRSAAPSLKRGRRLQITDRTGAVEELLLLDHGSAQAPQDLLFDLRERGAVVAMLSGLNCPIEMNCHPFLVFGQRRVGLR